MRLRLSTRAITQRPLQSLLRRIVATLFEICDLTRLISSDVGTRPSCVSLDTSSSALLGWPRRRATEMSVAATVGNRRGYMLAAVVLLLAILYLAFHPVLVREIRSRGSFVLWMAGTDSDRLREDELVSVDAQWRLHELQEKYNEASCATVSPHTTKNGRRGWLTAMINDNFVIPSVALSYVLKKFSCIHDMIALVTDGVSEDGRDALRAVGYDVRVVEPLDCNWMDVQLGREKSNRGIVSTHMRFHAWNFTEYSTLIYVDADWMPVSNVDELFDTAIEHEFSAGYCSRPGIVEPCFNAGMLVFRPNEKTKNEIMDMWFDMSRRGLCPNDQVLLWHYFAGSNRWNPISYAFNVRRMIYHPMRAYHFACCKYPKPWEMASPPTEQDARGFTGPLASVDDILVLWWRHFYNAIDLWQLRGWWARAQMLLRNGQKHG
eukprot:Opistho-2@20693